MAERAQELLHARQLAKDVDIADSDDRRSALSRHWARLSRRQSGFQVCGSLCLWRMCLSGGGWIHLG